jgi:hypothetical protein
MSANLRKKIHWTAITVLTLLAGLSLVACSQPNDPVSTHPFDAATPNITAHPQNASWDAGTDATHELSVTATRSDGGTLSYQWYSNTSNSSTSGTAVGTNSVTLTLNAEDYDENDTYFYYVVVTNTNNNATGKRTATATSNVAQIQVNGIGGIYDAEQPEITEHPQSGSWNVSTNATFELTVVADVEEGGSLSYQWYSNDSDSNDGGSALTGKTVATLTLSKADYATNGDYYFYVVVTNTNDNVTGDTTASVASDVATVTVSGNGSAPVPTPVPANLIGSWRVLDTPEKTYTVTSTAYSFSDDNDSYTGTIVNHVADGSGAGYFTIEYTANTINSSAVGKFSVIHYKNLTPSNVSVAGAYKAEDPDFGASGTGGKATKAEAETAYTVAAGYFADYSPLTKPLIDGVWRDGELTAAISSLEYTFDAENGKTYYVWWNDSETGPTPKNKTMDIRVSAKYSDEATYIFGNSGYEGVNDNWNTPQFFTADTTGSVTVIVTPFSEYSDNGSFAVAFSTASIRPGAAVSKTMTADQWADNTIATDEIHVYTINVTQGTEYRVWWNERSNGDGTKTADVQVQARYADDTIIFNDTPGYADQWIATAWNFAQSFTADKTGTVDLRVRPYDGSTAYPGTYGIVYSTSSTRPIKDSATFQSVTANGGSGTPTTTLTLTFDKAVYGFSAGDIFLTMPSRPIGVTKGTLSGDGPIYTLGISSPMDGTLTVTVGSVLFNITGSSKEVEIYNDGGTYITPLVENKWADGDIQDINDVDWYKIRVSAETIYRVWWNEDAGFSNTNGDGFKTGDVVVGAYNTDGTVIFGGTNTSEDSGWSTAQSFAPTEDGTGYVRVRAYGSNNDYIGTYGVVYSTGSTRPEIIYPDVIPVILSSVSANGGSGIPTTALTLVFNSAIIGLSADDITLSISSPFDVTKGTLSRIGTSYTLELSFPTDGTLTVTVEKFGYDISGSPKTVNIYGDNSITVTPLVAGQWEDGELTADNRVDWYSITVSAGTTYRIWWNDKYEGPDPRNKTADIAVRARYADGTNIFGNANGTLVDSSWDNARVISVTAAGTVYVRVMLYNGNVDFIGTYGIVFTANDDTRPEN